MKHIKNNKVGIPRQTLSTLIESVTKIFKRKETYIVNTNRNKQKNEQNELKPYHLPLREGIVNLKTSKILPYGKQKRPEYFIDLTYSKNSSGTEFEKFINSLFNNDKNYIQYFKKVMGYCITGEKIEDDFFMTKEGFAYESKMVLFEVFASILGNFAQTINVFPPRTYETVVTELSNSDNFKNTRLVLIEGTGNFENFQIIRRLISSKVAQSAKLWFIYETLDFIFLEKIDPYILRRIRSINFGDEFLPYDADLSEVKATLLAESEYILAWLIDGARLYYAEGFDTGAYSDRIAINYYKSYSDMMAKDAQRILDDFLPSRGITQEEFNKLSHEQQLEIFGLSPADFR